MRSLPATPSAGGFGLLRSGWHKKRDSNDRWDGE